MFNTNKKIKLIFALFFMFSINLFADTKVIFKINRAVNMYVGIVEQLVSVTLDDDGRITYIKNLQTERSYDFSKNSDQKYKEYINDRNIELIYKTDKTFRLDSQTYDFIYENSFFIKITKEFEKDRIDEYSIYQRNGDNFVIKNSWSMGGPDKEGMEYYEDGNFSINCDINDIKKLKSDNEQINLSNAAIIGYDSNLEPLVPFLFLDYDVINTVPVSYTATSELKETSAYYAAENLRKIEGLPWASENGYGINDKINIKLPRYRTLKLNFYNGFQSKEKSYLYKANSRAKKIRITSLENKISKEFELKDIPEKQLIDLYELYSTEFEYVTLQIEILEVYPGDKYKDLCIQAIIPEYW